MSSAEYRNILNDHLAADVKLGSQLIPWYRRFLLAQFPQNCVPSLITAHISDHLFPYESFYSTGCRFFRDMSRIGAECVSAPLEI